MRENSKIATRQNIAVTVYEHRLLVQSFALDSAMTIPGCRRLHGGDLCLIHRQQLLRDSLPCILQLLEPVEAISPQAEEPLESVGFRKASRAADFPLIVLKDQHLPFRAATARNE